MLCVNRFVSQLSRYKGGPALPRKLISQGHEHKQYNVEVYPLSLKVTDARDKRQSIVKLSRKVPIDFVADSFVLVSFAVRPMFRKGASSFICMHF